LPTCIKLANIRTGCSVLRALRELRGE
jgi:hypothetical protein